MLNNRHAVKIALTCKILELGSLMSILLKTEVLKYYQIMKNNKNG